MLPVEGCVAVWVLAGGSIFWRRAVTSTLMSGTFKLGINSVETQALAFNVDAGIMANRIQTDLGTGPVTVSMTGPDLTGGYTWAVTFTATATNYDVPQMTYVRQWMCVRVCVCAWLNRE
jgi:hypothetical protein